MFSILYSVMGGHQAIYMDLQSNLLSISSKEYLVPLVFFELEKGLVEGNIKKFKRWLTQKELWRICGDQTCSMNDMRRNGLSFIFKDVLGPDQSCMSAMEKMAELEQEEVPSNFPDAQFSFMVESMGSYEDSYEEHQNSYGLIESRSNIYSYVYYEYSLNHMGEI